MSSRILRRDRDGILGTNNSYFGQDSVADGLLDLLDLLEGLLLVQAIQKQINIGGGAESFMVVFTELSLGSVELGRDGKKTIDDGGAGRHDVIPVHVGERVLGKDAKVLLEILQRRDGGGRTVGASLVIGESHDVPVLFLFGFLGEVPGAGGDALGVLGEERKNIDVWVIEARVLAILGEDGTELGLVPAVRANDVDERLVGVVGNEVDQLRMGSWDGLKLDRHDGEFESTSYSNADRARGWSGEAPGWPIGKVEVHRARASKEEEKKEIVDHGLEHRIESVLRGKRGAAGEATRGAARGNVGQLR